MGCWHTPGVPYATPMDERIDEDCPDNTATAATYVRLQDAFDHFNGALFDGELPCPLITLQRKARSRGYFTPQKFVHRNIEGLYVDELALNPMAFHGHPDETILSFFVHLMCFSWQHHCGHASRPGYHNSEWAQKMQAIGLTPTSAQTDKIARTGDRVDYSIVPGGPFDVACRELLAGGKIVYFEDGRSQVERDRKAASKQCFSCPNCGQRVWGRSATRVRCDECDVLLVSQPAQARTPPHRSHETKKSSKERAGCPPRQTDRSPQVKATRRQASTPDKNVPQRNERQRNPAPLSLSLGNATQPAAKKRNARAPSPTVAAKGLNTGDDLARRAALVNKPWNTR